jgi:hypothetical protein
VVIEFVTSPEAAVRRIILLLLVALVAFIAFRALQAGWATAQAALWSQALWRQAERGPGAVVDLDEIGPSGWDRVFVFPPYTSHGMIRQSLGCRWPDVESTSIDMSDGVNLLVFVRDGEVVGWFEHLRCRGDFAEEAVRTAGYARGEASFLVKLDNEQRLVLTAR